jgi:hypothetical protein
MTKTLTFVKEELAVPLKETNGTLEIRTHTLSGKMQNSLWL